MKFLNIYKLDGNAELFLLILLQKALKKKKVDIATLENDHKQLQTESTSPKTWSKT